MTARRPSILRGNLLVLGLTSFFTDVSSEMIVPLLPVFLTATLGAPAAALGVIEGLADATAAVLVALVESLLLPLVRFDRERTTTA